MGAPISTGISSMGGPISSGPGMYWPISGLGCIGGSCGGSGAPDRLHLYRLTTAGLNALEITAHGLDFAPLVTVHRDSCDGAELACESADAATDLTLTLESPDPGWYFIVVDGRDGVGGAFSLDVTEIPATE